MRPEDKIRAQLHLYSRSWTDQIVYSGPVLQYLQSAHLPYMRLGYARLRNWLDSQLLFLTPVHLLSYNRFHRALLWEQMRQHGTNVHLSPLHGCYCRLGYLGFTGPYGSRHTVAHTKEVGCHRNAVIGCSVSTRNCFCFAVENILIGIGSALSALRE